MIPCNEWVRMVQRLKNMSTSPSRIVLLTARVIRETELEVYGYTLIPSYGNLSGGYPALAGRAVTLQQSRLMSQAYGGTAAPKAIEPFRITKFLANVTRLMKKSIFRIPEAECEYSCDWAA